MRRVSAKCSRHPEILRLIGLVLLLAAAGCAEQIVESRFPPPPATPIFDKLIVPGQRIGPVALEMTAPALLRTMGEPTRSWQYAASATYAFGPLRVTILESIQRVEVIGTDSPEYSTKEGIRVGSSELALRAVMGPPDRRRGAEDVRYLYCYNSGIQFEVRSGEVMSIGVWSPGCR